MTWAVELVWRRLVVGRDGTLEANSNTLVLVTSFFPPDAEVGALRTGDFAKFLSCDFGWNIVVVKAGHASHNQTLPWTWCRVRCVGERDSLRVLRLVRRIVPQKRASVHLANVNASAPLDSLLEQRSWLAQLSDLLVVPDRWRGWIRPASRLLRQEVRRVNHRCLVISSGPPHSAHVVAARVKHQTGAPWVADLRDPWGGNPYAHHLSAIAQRANERLERKTLMLADAIICNTKPAVELVANRLPDYPREQLFCVPNGYNEGDFSNLEPRPLGTPGESAEFLHVGSLYAKRTPADLINAWRILKEKRVSPMPQLTFLGNCEPKLKGTVDAAIKHAGLRGDIRFFSPRPRHVSLNAAAAADYLVLLGDSCSPQVQIPAKTFEYLRLQRPILALFPPDSPVRELVSKYAMRYSFANPNNAIEIASAVAELLAVHKMKKNIEPAKRDVRELSREQQVIRLHEILIDVVSHSSGR